MKNTILAGLIWLLPASAFGLEGIYVGGQVGEVFLSNTVAYSSALGFAGELGFRTNPVLAVNLRSQISSHSGGLTLWANTLAADVLIGNIYDIEVFLGGGPGFYTFNAGGTSDTRFGLHAELFGDLMASDLLRLGLGVRYDGVFSPTYTEGNFLTIMMRVGFYFGTP